ncbi:MAG: hypothetical protein R3B45_04185 [Bdellovibrionota bacterium]
MAANKLRSVERASKIKLILWIYFGLVSSLVFAQTGMQPLLSLNYGVIDQVPLVNSGLRDPEVKKNAIHDKYAAEEKVSETERLKSELAEKRTRNSRSLKNIYFDLFQAYAALTDFYDEALIGNIADESYSRENLNKRNIYRIALIKYADLYVKSVRKMTSSSSRALYHIHVNRYLIGSNQSASIKALQYILDKGHLNVFLKRRSQFLIAKWNVDHRNSNDIDTLDKLIKTLPRSAAIAARLTIARYYAGIHRNGRKEYSADNKYSRYLIAATKKSSRLNQLQKQKVLLYSIAIWRAVEGRKGSWEKPPIYLANYRDSYELNAIYERQAIDQWKSGKSSLALSKYKSLSKTYAGKKQMALIDRRILAMEEGFYLKSGKTNAYENSIVRIRSKYLTEQSSYEQSELMIENSNRRYSKLSHTELANNMSQKSSTRQRISAINLATRYLSRVVEDNNSREQELIQSQIAKLWVLNQSHKNAVRVYLLLANQIAPQKKSEYLTLALSSQHILARWPNQIPWKGLVNENNRERQQLLAIYSDLNSTRSVIDWYLIGHMGQLNIHLNNMNNAFALWENALNKDPKGPEAAKAAAIMIDTYKSRKYWQKLEDLARLCRSNSLVPIGVSNKSIDVNVMLALALLEGGKKALGDKNYVAAETKLKEFVTNFRSPNRDEGMFLLAHAYKGTAKYKDSIDTLISFSEEYPNSRFFKQAMLVGGDWSVPMAFEENAMFFYQTFLQKYPYAVEASRIQDDLVDLYIGRRLYAEAGEIFNKKINDSKASRESREEYALRLIRMEERFGSKERAEKSVNDLLKFSVNGIARAEALAVKARIHASRGEISQLVKIENELNGMDDRVAIQEVLSETRFLIAGSKLSNILQPIDSLTVKAPKKAISNRYGEYQSLKEAYQKVCESGYTSFCVPSLHRTARIAEQLISVIEDVNIPVTLPDATIKSFEAEKSSIIERLSKDIIVSDEKALAIVNSGYTDPSWTRQIFWQNGSDVNFEKVSGEDGQAYVQWPIPEE